MPSQCPSPPDDRHHETVAPRLAAAQLQVGFSCPQRDTIVVTPHGEADLAVVPDLQRAVGEAIDTGHRQIVVDLDRLTFMDATTLGVIVQARADAAAAGGVLTVRCHSRLGQLLLRTTGLGCLLEPPS
ncbi:MAG TPA: STAS domain-containing protein [Nocardioides sp.]|uniref:STAS domain-containing protein n=1 Tax=Nocardioides sp. TaxID=35761 RepID=UPI002ED95FB5